MEIPEGYPIRDNLKEALSAGHRAKDLVKQILAFSRQGEQEHHSFSVSLIVKEVLKLLRASLPSTIAIEQSLEAESDTVFADPTQIHQVLMNLCTNAAHAMRKKGGVLTISLEDVRIESDDKDLLPDLTPGHHIRLTVADTGHGIDPNTIERIFEPYFTTKKTGEGTGLGLSVVHGIVKSYKGAIAVDSELNKGTTFKILLPTIDREEIKETEIVPEIPRGTERILYVDDEKAIVDTIQQMLELLGYSIAAHTSSIDAMETFRANPQAFDLVITDQTMPNMTGDELTIKLLQIRADIPIIL